MVSKDETVQNNVIEEWQNRGQLVGAWIVGQKHYMGKLQDALVEKRDTPALKAAAQWLDRYFAGEKPEICEWLLPHGDEVEEDKFVLDPEGTQFQQLVWELLCEIPYGEMMTYGELAKAVAHRLGRESMSAQAVGQAVGHNPISIIIPCHRVIGADGTLTGYAGGIGVKEWLLAHERKRKQRRSVTEYICETAGKR